MDQSWRRRFVVGIGLWAVMGCGARSRPALLPTVPPIPVDWQDEAARSGLAVISVAPWEDYAATLQPAFALTAAQALQQALPISMRQQSELLDAFRLGVRLAPPTTSRAVTAVETVTDDTTTSQRTTTTQRQPGDLSAVPEAAAPNVPGAIAVGGVLAGDVATNPLTRYSAATALYQEVQLLNSYVKDAALAQNADVYVVRLQVSLLPQLRSQAYDAYTTLTFSTEVQTDRADPVFLAYSQRVIADKESSGTPSDVTVLPILVTDSLEQSLASTSLARAREYALSLIAMTQGLGIGADVGRQIQSLQAALGDDTNSLLTVSKVSPNALRVRFGALFQVGSGLAMVPSNRTVTAVLLVPPAKTDDKAAPSENANAAKRVIKVLSKLEVVDATTGKPLRERPFDLVEQLVLQTVGKYLDPGSLGKLDEKTGRIVPPEEAKPKVKAANALAFAVQANDQKAFADAMEVLGADQISKDPLWLDLLAVVSRNSYAATSFELPPPPLDPKLPDQKVMMVDDGTSASTSVRIERAPASRTMAATLVAKTTNDEFPLPATAIDAGNGFVHLRFPAIQPLGICASGCTYRIDLFRITSENRWAPSSRSHTLLGTFPVTRVVPSDPPAKPPTVLFTVTSGARSILRTATGEGKIQLVFRRDKSKLDEPVFFTVEGGDVAAIAPPGAVQLTRSGWQLLEPGPIAALTVSLTNLVDDVDVRVTPSNGTAAKEPLVLRVRTVPAKE